MRHFYVSLFATAALCLLSMTSTAFSTFSVGNMFLTMPDTLMPYITPQERVAYIFGKKGLTSFESEVTLDSVSTSYLKLNLDSTATIEMLTLPSQNNDTVCCVIRTIHLPQHDSEVTLYDRSWKQLRTINLRGSSIDEACRYFTAKPDTMSQERYNELLRHVSFLTVEANVISATELRLTPSVPLLFKEDEDSMKAILLQRNVKWKEGIFK